MSSVKTSAIVLKSINWKDSSKIVTLFTREEGKINVIAKGSRRSKSPYRGVLESINLVEVIIHFSANRQLQILGQATLEKSFHKIRTDYKKIGYVFALLESTDIFFQQGAADPVFFDFLVILMDELQKTDHPNIIFWYFLLKLSSYLGFRPELSGCKVCDKELKSQAAIFSIQEGTVICYDCSKAGKTGWEISAKALTSLIKLQRANHKKLSMLKLDIESGFAYTDFLLTYLRYHTEEKLELSALKLF